MSPHRTVVQTIFITLAASVLVPSVAFATKQQCEERGGTWVGESDQNGFCYELLSPMLAEGDDLPAIEGATNAEIIELAHEGLEIVGLENRSDVESRLRRLFLASGIQVARVEVIPQANTGRNPQNGKEIRGKWVALVYTPGGVMVIRDDLSGGSKDPLKGLDLSKAGISKPAKK